MCIYRYIYMYIHTVQTGTYEYVLVLCICCPSVPMVNRPWPVRHYDTVDVNDEVAYIPEALLLSIPAREVPPTKVKETPTEVKDVYHRKANRGIYSPHIYIHYICIYLYM